MGVLPNMYTLSSDESCRVIRRRVIYEKSTVSVRQADAEVACVLHTWRRVVRHYLLL